MSTAVAADVHAHTTVQLRALERVSALAEAGPYALSLALGALEMAFHHLLGTLPEDVDAESAELLQARIRDLGQEAADLTRRSRPVRGA